MLSHDNKRVLACDYGTMKCRYLAWAILRVSRPSNGKHSHAHPPAWAGESRSCLACLQAVGPVHLHLHLHLGPKSPLAFPAPVAAPRASHLKAPVASSAFLSSTSTASPDGIDQPNAQPHQRRLQRASEFAVDALSIPDELFDVESPPQAN
ncbi:hypothetical protein SUNI508_06629 [Seiridium unicorne]|uniref:C2H2-type domain-containing protein n=1 Tax=Seiridium unicorne TaxID=138068 RepID=A0ABR2V1K5_9PEZI